MPALFKKKFQVFVSSTFNDLKEERQEAVGAILKAGHIPAGMELFTAGNKSQLEVVKKWIDDSDVYMLILGTRYGSIEPISLMSYTEVEYDYAVSLGKPIFSVVLSDKYRDTKLKNIGNVALEENNSDKLLSFRAKVMNVMCSIIDEVKDVRGAVYENLIEITNSFDLIGWVPSSIIEDTRPLRDQISALEQDNRRLQGELDSKRLSANSLPSSQKAKEEFKKLYKILQKTVAIKAEVSVDNKDGLRVIDEMLLLNSNLLIRGWNLGVPPSKINKWFEEDVFPALLVHRLIVKAPLSNAPNRYVITEKGLDYLAWRDAMQLAISKE